MLNFSGAERLEESREDIIEEERIQVDKAAKKQVKDFPCAQCTQVCKNQYHLSVHVKAKHEQKQFKCKYCDRSWPTNTQNNGHQSRCSKRPESQTITLEEEDPRCVDNLGHCHCHHNIFFFNLKIVVVITVTRVVFFSIINIPFFFL